MDSTSLFVGDQLFVADPLGITLSIFVVAMGVVVGTFASRSLAAHPHARRFFIAAGALTASTVALALANQPWVLTASWIAVSISTVTLIGFDGRPDARRAARRAAATFAVGDIALVVATMVHAGASPVTSAQVTGIQGTIIALGIVLAACSRSAQIPLHGWLTASVAAPTPVSALLHAGVVNGSAILLLRWHPTIAGSAVATTIAVAAGLTSVILAMAVARTRPDVKSGLAWTTSAQMGFMIIQCSLGLTGPAVIHLMAHGMFKSSLFLGSGSGLERGGSHAHPSAVRPGWATSLAAAAGGGLATGASLLLVQPTYLENAAAIVPIAFTWVTLSYALVQWWTRTGRTSIVGVFAATAAALASTAIASGVEHWLSIPDIAPHEFLVTLLGWTVVAAVGLAMIAGRMVSQRSAEHDPDPLYDLESVAWMRIASAATPTSTTGSYS